MKIRMFTLKSTFEFRNWSDSQDEQKNLCFISVTKWDDRYRKWVNLDKYYTKMFKKSSKKTRDK